MSWTLEQDGTEKSFADWGLGRPQLNEPASAAAELTVAAVEPVDGVDLLTGNVIVRRDGVVVFSGIVVETPKSGDGSGESGMYRARDFWHLLEQTVFHQSRKSWDNATEQLVDVFTTHCWLGQRVDGTYQNTGEQMAEALSYARDVAALEGYDFQFDATGFPALDVPVNEVRDVTCAEVLRLMLRWSPDAVVWLDYSTFEAGGPTFRCKRRQALDAVSLAIDDDRLAGLEITPRADLLRPAVKLTYEIAEQVDGTAYVRTLHDIHPPTASGRELGALAATINLQGAVVQTIAQEVVADPIAAAHTDTATRLAWWKKQFPELAGDDIQSVEIDAGTVIRSGVNTYPNQLVDGTLADWMGVQHEEEVVTAKAFIQDDTGGHWKTLPVRLLATNATTGEYRFNQAVSHPEPIPVGLAADVFEGVSVLHFQGSLVLREEEASGALRVGQVLNLTGGAAEWASMRALIYRVAVDLESGETRVEFGNPEHLGVPDLVELLRAARSRNLSTLPLVRTSGVAGVGGSTTVAKKLPNRINTGKETAFEKHVIKKAGLGEISIDATQAYNLADSPLVGAINGKILRVREVPFCDDGTERKILLICSEVYD